LVANFDAPLLLVFRVGGDGDDEADDADAERN
jgi:hypothetical protein